MKPTADISTTYARQAEELAQALSAIPTDCLGLRPSETRWSILEIAGHLADAELLASVRIRRTLTQDRPNFWGYQQELWATALGYQQERLDATQERFMLLRRGNAGLLIALTERLGGEAWEYSGVHDEIGRLSLRQLIEDYIAHTAKHLEQIREIAAELVRRNEQPKGNLMAKTQELNPQMKDAKEPKKKGKDAKGKDGKALIGRVKKAIKKSRRKMSEEKFERELQRTILFLENMQQHLNHAPLGEPGEPDKAAKKDGKKAAKKGNGKGKSNKSLSKSRAKSKPPLDAQLIAPAIAQPEPAATGE